MASQYCVYMHTAPNGKKYIGITKQELNRRWRNGFGYKRNAHFYSAIIKYGWDNIKHEICAQGLTIANAEEVEKLLISQHKTKDRRFGYNNTDGGDGTQGYIPGEETRSKMSAARTGEKNWLYGKHLADETKQKISLSRIELYRNTNLSNKMRDANPNRKTVYQYLVSGGLVKVWDSRHQAENEFKPGKKSPTISKCCQGGCSCAYGFIWSYTPLEDIDTPKRLRNVFQYSADGKTLIRVWDNLETAVKEFRTGKLSTVISQCVSGHRPVAYGYYWSYLPQLRGDMCG